MGVDQFGQAGLDVVGSPGPRHGELDHVVDRPPMTECARAAGVVADHAADGAPGMCRRVGPEPQPVLHCGPLQVGMHHTRLHHRRTSFGIDGDDLAEVLAGVDDDPLAHRVAGDRRAGAPHGHGHPRRGCCVEDGVQLIAVAWPGDHLRDDAIQGSVGGMERPRQDGVVAIGDTATDQLLEDTPCRFSHATHHPRK